MIDNNREIIHIYTIPVVIYFAIAPFEDLLTSSIGTVAKYVAVLIVVLGISSQKSIRFKADGINFCVLWLMIVSVISIIWSIDYTATITAFRTYLLIPALFLYVRTLDFNQREYNIIINGCIIGGCILLFYLYFSGTAVNLYLDNRLRLDEQNDPNNLAALILCPICFLIGALLHSKGFKRVVLFLPTIGLALLLFYTGSRGGMIAFACMLLTFIALGMKKNRIKRLLLIAIIIVITWMLIGQVLSDDIVNRLFTLDSYRNTILDKENRWGIWKNIVVVLVSHVSIFGLGAGCPGIALASIYGHIRGVHNTYLNMVAEFGVLGIPAFIILLKKLMKAQLKRRNITECALLVSTFVAILFLDSYTSKFLWNALMIVSIKEMIDLKKVDSELP